MNPIVICIEGSIGVGKSTMISELKTRLKNSFGDRPIVYQPEPVDMWMAVRGMDGTSILEKFYADQVRHAFSFQTLALITIAKQLREVILSNPGAIIITERSIYSSKSVFVRSLYDAGMITDTDIQIYEHIFQELEALHREVIPAKYGMIYLNASPHECLQRVKQRNRKGEESIELSYLTKCTQYHDDFFDKWSGPKAMCKGDNVMISDVIIAISELVDSIESKDGAGNGWCVVS